MPRLGRADRAHLAVVDLEVLGGDLELLRGDGEQPRAGLLGRALDRAPVRVGDLAAAGDAAVGRRAGVAGGHADAVLGEAERLGGDRHERVLDPAHVRRRGDDRELAVGVELADRRGGLEAAGPEAERDADALVLGQVVALRVQRVALDRLEALAGAEDLDLLAVDALVAGDEDVLEPQLDRVDLQLLRELVDQRLDRERGGRRAGRAVGAGADAVGRRRRARSGRARASGTGRRRASCEMPRRPCPPSRRGRR